MPLRFLTFIPSPHPCRARFLPSVLLNPLRPSLGIGIQRYYYWFAIVLSVDIKRLLFYGLSLTVSTPDTSQHLPVLAPMTPTSQGAPEASQSYDCAVALAPGFCPFLSPCLRHGTLVQPTLFQTHCPPVPLAGQLSLHHTLLLPRIHPSLLELAPSVASIGLCAHAWWSGHWDGV